MNWLEISVKVHSGAVDAVEELFNAHGHGGAVVEALLDCFEHELPEEAWSSHATVKTYLPLDGTAQTQRALLEDGLRQLGQRYSLSEPAFRQVGDRDWAEAWKEAFHRLHVGQRVVIVPAWEEYQPAMGEVVIYLEPGMAFGTGLHPTTRLCLEALQAYLLPGCTALDVGTGSGVLAIAAAKLGAGSVLALDADPVAVAVAHGNVTSNGVAAQVSVRHGSLPGGEAVPSQFFAEGVPELHETGQYDLVLVNILAPVIVGMASALAARLSSSGVLIVAGLFESQEMEVVEALQSEGLELLGRSQREGWVCLEVRKG